MTVLTTPVVKALTPLAKAAIQANPIPEVRPVTATLVCPVILDITFLKKLDMTSFTKKGLIAISKICGISLIKRSDDKKIRKRLKRHAAERVKKEARKRTLNLEFSDEHANNLPKPKWSTVKEVPKIKVSGSSGMKIESIKSISPRGKSRDVKPSVDDILYGPVEMLVIEPCKTCGRSKQPERFHSHPNQSSGRNLIIHKKVVSSFDESGKRRDDGKLTAPRPNAPRRHSTGHLQSSSRLRVADLEPSFHSDHEIETIKMSKPKFEANQKSFSPSVQRRKMKSKESAEGSKTAGNEVLKSGRHQEWPLKKRGTMKEPPSSHDRTSGYSAQHDLKYVTGCYVCGKHMSPELRFSHEEQCIAEWRRQNSHLPPDKRKAEPLRPDFRFTATGDVDFEGTFNSIWANHKDSLVPCAKCKRTFFPERIEKHQACCNIRPIKSKHTTSKNK